MIHSDSDGNFYAADFDLDALRSMAVEKRDLLNFVGFPERHGYDALNEFFPFNTKYGKEDPSDTQLSSGKDIRKWRNYSWSDQLHLLEQAKAGPTPAERAVSRCRSQGTR